MSECNHNWSGRMVDPGYPDCLICKVDNLQAKLDAVKEENKLLRMAYEDCKDPAIGGQSVE